MNNRAAKVRGSCGEDFAARWLESKGYRVLARNYHTRQGELDIVAEKEGVLAFVEVKTRAKNALISGAEAVTPEKQRRIIAAALAFAEEPDFAACVALQPRFDVLEITVLADRRCRVRHLTAAFDLSEQITGLSM